MAAITYWVDPVSGSDSNDGLSFANAMATTRAVSTAMVAAGNGNDYTVNLVNTGTHIFTGSVTQIDGQTTSTWVIQGTDSAGSPAWATCQWETLSEAIDEGAFYIRDNAGITIQNVICDYTTVTGSASNGYVFVQNRDAGNGPLVFRYCQFIFATGTTTPAGTRTPLGKSFGTPQAPIVFSGCLFQNAGANLFPTSYMTDLELSENVFIYETDSPAAVTYNLISTSNWVITNNTWYIKNQSAVGNGAFGNGMLALGSTSDAGSMVCKDNVLWIDASDAQASVSPIGFFNGTATSGITFSTEDISNNMFYAGPALESLSASSSITNYTEWPWNPGVDDQYSGDVRRDNQANTTVFNDPSSTYDWTPTDSALAITLPRDLRLLIDTTASSTGGVPGALGAGVVADTGVTIEIAPSLESATWELSGAVNTSGTGSTTLTGQTTGATTITWGAVTGYHAPASETLTGTTGATISFTGSYSLVEDSTVVTFQFADTSAPAPSIPNSDALKRFDPANVSDWFDYEFVVWSGAAVESVHRILAVTATTTGTSFELSGEPDLTTSGLQYAISPTRTAKENFFSKYPYERSLVEGTAGRTNTWPSHSAVTDLLLFAGDEYDTFVETELARALSADTVGASPPTNVLWRKLTPAGIKSLDNDDQILQKLVLVLGMSFDKIRLYQEQLSYAHTIGYQDYNHVPRTLVRELAKLWGWTLTHDSKNNDLTTYNLAVYDHYATGTTDAVSSLSAADINFERWRRIVSSLVRIWKAKGTRKAIELVLDVYGIPSDLLVIKEYVYFLDRQLKEPAYIREIPTGVFVTTGQTQTRNWVDPGDGSVETIQNRPIYNVRYLDIGVAETEAIFKDVYSWAQDTSVCATTVNGVTVELSAHTSSIYDFEQELVNLFIPSDGSHRTATSYPLLEAVYASYLNNSTNAYKYGDFDAFIDFIEENFNEIVKQLVPASSRLLAQGNIVQNLPWHRQKYVWEPEGDVPQPFNGEKVWNLPSISGNQQTKVEATITAADTAASKPAQHDASVDVTTVSASHPEQYDIAPDVVSVVSTHTPQQTATISTAFLSPEYIEQPQDAYELVESPAGALAEIDTPIITPYSANSGSAIFTAFSPSALIVTNDNKFDLYLSASNMSQSGTNRIIIELFRRLDEEELAEIAASAFTVQQTVYEGSTFTPTSSRFGTYKLSSVKGLAIGDTMAVESELSAYLAPEVLIVNIFTGTNKVTVTPPIGLDNLPVGSNATKIGLRTFFTSEAIVHIIRALEEERIPHNVVIQVCGWLYRELPPIQQRALSDAGQFAEYLVQVSQETNIPLQTLQGVFRPFYQFTTAELASTAIVIPFLRDNLGKYELSTDRKFIFNALINRLAAVTLRKSNQFFDWANPVSTKILDQDSQGAFAPWPENTDLVGITDTNDRVISGALEIGGFDILNNNILRDKEEYFIRWKADAEVTSGFTGDTYFSVYSGRNVVSSNFYQQVINNVYYYGNYFVYMQTSKEAVFDSTPDTYGGTTTGRSETASVEIQFHGVGDSDRLEIQFVADGTAPDYDSPTAGPSQVTTTYNDLTTGHWATATTIVANVKSNADDRTVYSIQTTLEPSTWYWWRVRNSKQKLSMFGYTLESITHSKPQLFFTGDFKDTDAEEGINPDTPEPPDAGSPPSTSGGGSKLPDISEF